MLRWSDCRSPSTSTGVRNSQQELLEALQVMAWGFGHGLGLGLGVWTRFGVRWEELSEGEEDEGQEQRCGWNDTLS